jgi:hypothetical protein
MEDRTVQHSSSCVQLGFIYLHMQINIHNLTETSEQVSQGQTQSMNDYVSIVSLLSFVIFVLST